MFNNLPPLAWLRAFEATARLGNFTRAAEELGLTPSAVSYQVRALEADLGQPLFRRHRRMLSLTPAGQAYRPVVSRAFADIDAGTGGIFGQGRGQPVTIRCVSSLNILWLVPRLSDFRRAHPGITLRVLSASWTEGTTGDAIDVDIRFGDGSWSDAEVRPLMQHAIVPVVRADMATHGAADLPSSPLIEVAGVSDTWRHFFARIGQEDVEVRPAITVDQSLVALELARQGLGMALVAEVFARPYLADGRLVRAHDACLPATGAHYLAFPHGGQAYRREVTTLVDWLQDAAAR